MAQESAKERQPFDARETREVLAAEYRLIWGEELEPATEAEYFRRMADKEQAALCLSGGGIRSASFGLGVIQALSGRGLLGKFHYLSTVSGGGYIGSWLQRWIHGAGGDVKAVEDALARSVSGAGGDGVEPDQIKALRENSNFITPRIGIGSADTWTAVATAARNIAVNWLLFAPLLLLVVMIPNLARDMLSAAAEWAAPNNGKSGTLLRFYLVQAVPILLALVCAWRAAWFTCRALPSYRGVGWPQDARKPKAGAKPSGDAWLMRKIVLWLILWAVFGSFALWIDLNIPGGMRAMATSTAETTVPGPLLFSGSIFALLSLGTSFLALLAAGNRLRRGGGELNYRASFRRDLPLWLGALAFGAALIPLGCNIFVGLFCETRCGPQVEAWFAVLAPLWLMVTQLLVAFLFAALRRDREGRKAGEAGNADGDGEQKSGRPATNADSDREWLARLSAIKIRPMLLWMVLSWAVLLLLPWLENWKSGEGLSLAGLLTLLTGGTALSGGHAAGTGNTTRQGKVNVLRYLPLSAIVSLATFAFLVLLLAMFSVFERFLATLGTGKLEEVGAWLGSAAAPYLIAPEIVGHLLLAGVAGGLLLVLNKRIPVNRFSLSGFYRNRLGRAFLGGARAASDRDPDVFTGFDPKDNVDLHALRPAAGRPASLYPVINVALNVTASDNLAWQERKAEPFILSPLFCGSAMLSPEQPPASPDTTTPDSDVKKRSGAYIPSESYAGSEPEMKKPEGGISLATAMAISGAAASPNMGYHSSAATAFLMTLFNVRLGQWMPNPACGLSLRDRIYRASPSSSLRALLRELGGSTDDKALEVYLSDGGHFENLALYEMVRRRCRFVVLSDAGADPDCAFVDLGNAIRKIKIDLGIDVKFERMRISSRTRQIDNQQAWAIGTIHYPEGVPGRILYLKPSFYDRELPMDVVAYAKASASFPHESTADQFFSESQFESYRRLGYTLASEIGGPDAVYGSVAEFFETLAPGGEEGNEEDRVLEKGLLAWLRGLRGTSRAEARQG